jgi:ABC-type transport system involved in Fe-S cluster assembly fused permease/ATPase subunit
MIRIITGTMVTTMEAVIMVMVAVMGEEGGIGTTIQMVVMRIVATTVGQIALGEVGAVVVVAGAVRLLLL